MHVSVRTLYGLRALTAMSDGDETATVHARDLSEELDASKNYLNQILGTLRDEEIVETKKGPHGGFRLSRSAEEITLGDVIRALEGPTIITDCTRPEFSDCQTIPDCSTQTVLSGVAEHIMDYLDTVSIADIRDQKDLSPIADVNPT